MIEEQKVVNIEKDALLSRVTELRDSGYRLAQIGCTPLEGFELSYSFDRDYKFISLKLTVPREGAEIPSISGIYWNAFIYENELHDLFGIKVKDIEVDYKGNFYRTAVKFPFSRENTGKKGEEGQ